MADMNSRGLRKRMSRIYKKELYEISDRYNSKAGSVRNEPTPTVASAIHDMCMRVFSVEAIYRDLEELGITTCVDIAELAQHVAVTPLSHLVLCSRHKG